jgi:hypothetical protein
MSNAIRKLIAKLDKGPRELFFYPGLALLLFGAVVSMLLPDPVYITANISLDIHTFLVSALTILIGMQCVSFAVVVRRYAAARGLLPRSKVVQRYLAPITLERVLLVALLIGLFGLDLLHWCVGQWADAGFGPLNYGVMIKPYRSRASPWRCSLSSRHFSLQ